MAPETLRQQLAGEVVLPGDDGWEVARQAWNLTADLRPVAVVYAESADDVVGTVRYASEHGACVAFLGGGHNAGIIDWSRDTILLRTERMTGVTIDPEARSARVEAGVLSRDLAAAAGEHGLAYLAGTAADVGVIGLTTGGGVGWLVRKLGLTCNTVIAADIVTADGRLRHIDADHDPDLFWAIRGGGGNVGAITALELRLFPIAEVYAGGLLWPIDRAREILGAWRSWIERVPDECESLGRLLQLPDLPDLPPHLRGRSFVVIEAAIIGSEADGAALIARLRELGPEIDTFAMLPTSQLSVVHMDPDHPLPYGGDGILLADFPTAAVDPLVDAFVGSSLLQVEIRQLGGAAAVRSPDHGVLAAIDDPFIAFAVGVAPTPEAGTAVRRDIQGVFGGLAPWDGGRRYLNFAETKVDPETLLGREAVARLRRIRQEIDPAGVFVANHPVG